MTVTKDTVAHYAKLASLHFSEDETEALAGQLESILGYVQKISELDLSDVDATTRVQLGPVAVRADVVGKSLGQERALANAPDAESGHFLVPKVIKR
jgi:aspartyl-tRNA(Asn)/glutamyl-tRNA(Gln) amidotransferase subunit C